MTTRIVFRSARIFDGESDTLRATDNVVVEAGVIREISDRPLLADDEVVDCAGRVLMPGLIDAHVHVYAAGLNIGRSACAVNAEILRETGKLGCIREGATADILVVDGNPLEDISVLGSGGDRLSIIMREGRFHKRRI